MSAILEMILEIFVEMYLEIMLEIFPKSKKRSKLAYGISVALALTVVLLTFIAFVFGIGIIADGERVAIGIIILAFAIISTLAQIVGAAYFHHKNED